MGQAAWAPHFLPLLPSLHDPNCPLSCRKTVRKMLAAPVLNRAAICPLLLHFPLTTAVHSFPHPLFQQMFIKYILCAQDFLDTEDTVVTGLILSGVLRESLRR